jgi:hypothetical protein
MFLNMGHKPYDSQVHKQLIIYEILLNFMREGGEGLGCSKCIAHLFVTWVLHSDQDLLTNLDKL